MAMGGGHLGRGAGLYLGFYSCNNEHKKNTAILPIIFDKAFCL